MNNPLVSVAIVTYNQKEFLIEAIESVLQQDYDNIEIIVGDDCSIDGSQNLLLDYQTKYPEKFVLKFSHKNEGITKNANKVQDSCNGKYIAWLGGDDLMLPTKIKKQVEFLESNEFYNIVYHNLDVFESSNGKHLYFYNSAKEKYTGDIKTLIKHGTFNGACSTMFRKSAAAYPAYNPLLPVASDWLYTIEHLRDGKKIGYIDEVLGKYRRHQNNVSSPTSPLAKQGLADTFKTAEILLEKYPQCKREIYYWYSTYYRGLRKYSYYSNLKKSIYYSKLNYKSFFLLTLYFISFKRIKM